MVIVDTSVLIDYLADRATPQTDWLEKEIDHRRVGITNLILIEVLQGIHESDRFTETLHVLSRFAIFETGSIELAIRSARNYRTLRGLGITVRNTIDCMIATFCIGEGHLLLHNDRDFDPFESHLGLKAPDVSGAALN